MGYTFLLFIGGFIFYYFNKNKTSSIENIAGYLFFTLTLACVFATLNLLLAFNIAMYIITICIFIYILFKNKNSIKDLFKEFFTFPVFLLFLTLIGFYFIFLIKDPHLHYWDDLIAWARVSKITVVENTLYTMVSDVGKYVVYPPGSTILVYLTHSFKSFSDATLLYSYALLFSVIFALITEFIYKKTKLYSITTLSFIGFLLSPFAFRLFTTLNTVDYIAAPYYSAMVDINISLVFISIIAIYLHNRKSYSYVWAIIYLCLIKDVGLIFALLAAGIILVIEFIDLLKQKNKNILKFFIKNILINFSAALFPYFLWAFHLSKVIITRDAVSAGTSWATMLIEGLKQIFIQSNRSEDFIIISQNFINYIVNMPVIIFGTGLNVFLITIALSAITICLADKNNRIYAFLINFFTILGSVGYLTFIFLCYLYIFRGDERFNLSGLDRYGNTAYFIMLFIAIITLIVFCQKKYLKVITSGISAIVLIVGLISFNQIGHYHTVFGFPHELINNDATYITKENIYKVSPDIYSLLIIDQNTNGNFAHPYQLYPIRVNAATEFLFDSDVRFILEGSEHEGENYYLATTTENFEDAIIDMFDHVLIVNLGDSFENDFGYLFDKPLLEGDLFKRAVIDGELQLQFVDNIAN